MNDGSPFDAAGFAPGTAATSWAGTSPAGTGNNLVELRVGGTRYAGWQEVRVTRGLERACADFEIKVSERWPSMDQPWVISPGSACEIFIGSDLVVTGWVDAYKPSFAATSHDVSVTGRSKTCDFVDSSVDVKGGQFNGQTVLQIAQELAKPFKLEVVDETATAGGASGGDASADEGEDGSDVVPDAQVQQSETCFQLVERLARLQELLLTDDAQGRLVLTHAGDKKASSGLKQGDNILSASADLDDSKRFQKYIVKAQRPGNRTKDGAWAKKSGKDPFADVPIAPIPATASPSEAAAISTANRARWRAAMLAVRVDPRGDEEGSGDGDDGEGDGDGPGTGGGHDNVTDRGASVITQIKGWAKDEGVKRYRVHVIMAEAAADDMDAEQRADWECRRRIAKAMKATATVIGWRQRDGRLWATNEMVAVDAPWLGLKQELVVSEVEFQLGTGGETTQLTLTLPDAFLPEKIKKKKAKRKGKGHGKHKKGGGGGDIFAGVGH